MIIRDEAFEPYYIKETAGYPNVYQTIVFESGKYKGEVREDIVSYHHTVEAAVISIIRRKMLEKDKAFTLKGYVEEMRSMVNSLLKELRPGK